ncbi:MAG: hypothetical protein LWW74_06870, partial [Burkholderiales bacterium]|nr:hypothetical protein [Burkholderiales bacterium]
MTTEFKGVVFPAERDELLKMTKDILRTNRRLVAVVINQQHALDAIIGAYNEDDGHKLAQLVLEYQSYQKVAQAL